MRLQLQVTSKPGGGRLEKLLLLSHNLLQFNEGYLAEPFSRSRICANARHSGRFAKSSRLSDRLWPLWPGTYGLCRERQLRLQIIIICSQDASQAGFEPPFSDIQLCSHQK
jgi:hypothetical protein